MADMQAQRQALEAQMQTMQQQEQVRPTELQSTFELYKFPLLETLSDYFKCYHQALLCRSQLDPAFSFEVA